MKYSSIAVAQIDTTVGDFESNVETILTYAHKAYDDGADLVIYPELAVCGYPPQDMLERPAFIEANIASLDDIASRAPDLSILVGYAAPNADVYGKKVHNAVALLEEGEVRSRHFKRLLPTYDVFDEARYFEPAEDLQLLDERDNLAVTICEDIWNDPELAASYGQPRYETNPLEWVEATGADILINVSASPFVRGKDRNRTRMIQQIAEKYDLTVILANLVGGNDSLIFDGNSLVVNDKGDVLRQAEGFEEDLFVYERENPVSANGTSFPSEPGSVYQGLTLGLSDYLGKCGFRSALIGLSGGIDSSLTASLAVDALGQSNVLGVLMPSEISSEGSVTDAEKLADNLGIETRTFPIQGLFNDYLDLFEDEFEGMEWDHTEENLQARIRGNILMALSNKYGHILLTTGNKSELAVGYCTLYGDMNGGLAVISDVPKTMVYELAEYRNERDHVIPQNVLDKPPSAELSPDQKDEDELPPYEILDEIIRFYVEERMPPREIIQEGFEDDVVHEVVQLIDLNEYKRQQAPIGLKITSKAFTIGWRMPIAQRFETR
jgi:NAD+ synthase (glutamine-hydrolysing)